MPFVWRFKVKMYGVRIVISCIVFLSILSVACADNMTAINNSKVDWYWSSVVGLGFCAFNLINSVSRCVLFIVSY